MSSNLMLGQMKEQIRRGEKVDDVRYTRLILQKVSRTYALTIRSLGQPFREPVLIGYLLCRIADTYEDTISMPFEKKVKALDLFAGFFDNFDDFESTAPELHSLVSPYFSFDND